MKLQRRAWTHAKSTFLQGATARIMMASRFESEIQNVLYVTQVAPPFCCSTPPSCFCNLWPRHSQVNPASQRCFFFLIVFLFLWHVQGPGLMSSTGLFPSSDTYQRAVLIWSGGAHEMLPWSLLGSSSLTATPAVNMGKIPKVCRFSRSS